MSESREKARRSEPGGGIAGGVCEQEAGGQRERCGKPDRPGLSHPHLWPQLSPACLLGSSLQDPPSPPPVGAHTLCWGRVARCSEAGLSGSPPRYALSMEGAGGAPEGPRLPKAPLVA